MTVRIPHERETKKNEWEAEKGEWDGCNVFWGNWKPEKKEPPPSIELTPSEEQALKAKYAKQNRNPNYRRAELIKSLMLQGKTLTQIQSALAPFKGCGADSVARDHAALNHK